MTNTIELISPSFFSDKEAVLQHIKDSHAGLLVLPLLAELPADAAWQYPSIAELQDALDKGQRLLCQQSRHDEDKPPRQVLLSRKQIHSLGRLCRDEELNEPQTVEKRLRKRRIIEIQQQRICVLFADESHAVSPDMLDNIQADLLLIVRAVRSPHSHKLSAQLKRLSVGTSVALLSHNDSTHLSMLANIKTSLKLFNNGTENRSSVVWHAAGKFLSLAIPLDD